MIALCREGGRPRLFVNATEVSTCINGPSAALTAFLGVRAHLITCGFDHVPGSNDSYLPDGHSFLIYPAENYEYVCTESATLLNSRLGGEAFYCSSNPGAASGTRIYSWLYVNGTDCEAKVAALNTAIFGACDFASEYIPDWAVRWNLQACEPLTVCAVAGTTT